ncbi:hypothetical protein Pelo_18286 [Pelomyxa schiedti]|nr:hypothetical protein Pelo_18286 [Pelomyxa schiedti]
MATASVATTTSSNPGGVEGEGNGTTTATPQTTTGVSSSSSSNNNGVAKKDFRKKHAGSATAVVVPPIADAVAAAAVPSSRDPSTKTIACGAAHEIANRLGVTPLEVGVQLDLLNIRICDCSMGIFSWGHNKLEPMLDVPADLRAALESTQSEGRISCAALWRISDELHINKSDAARACDTLKLRIAPCQLGAF